MNKLIKSIKEDYNFLCGLELKDYDVKLYFTDIGTDHVHYRMFYDNELLFEGKDFRQSPMYGIDSLKSIASLLSFLTLDKNAVDSDFFADWNVDQLYWRDNVDKENIKLILFDLECFDSEEKDNPDYKLMKDSVKYLQSCFIEG